VVEVAGPEIIQVRVPFPFFAGELQLRAIGISPGFLDIAVRTGGLGKNHAAAAVGDNPGGVDLIGHVIEILVGLGFVFGDQAGPGIDVVADTTAVLVVFGQELAVIGVEVIGINRFRGVRPAGEAGAEGMRR